MEQQHPHDPSEAVTEDLPWRALPPAPATILTLGQWLHHDRRQSGRTKSVQKTLRTVLGRIPPDFLSFRLSDLSRRHFNELFRWLRGQGLEATTLHMFRSTLAASLERALELELVQHNPARISAKVLPPDRPRPAFRPENQHLSVEEASILVSSELVPLIRRVGYAVELFTGVRIGELVGLRWEHVELGALPILRIEVQWQGEYTPTKTGDIRRVPLHPELGRLLAFWRERWPGRTRLLRAPAGSDLVVPGLFRGRLHPQCPDRYNERLREDLAALGIRTRTSHALRKSMLQLLLDAGADQGAIESLTHRERKRVSTAYMRWNPSNTAPHVLKHPVRIVLPEAQLDLFGGPT